MMAFSIRQARRDDLPELIRLARGTFIAAFTDDEAVDDMLQYVETAFSPQQTEREFETPGSQFFLVEGLGGLLGYMKLNQGEAQSDSGLNNALQLQRIYVRRTAQGMGIGKALLTHAFRLAEQDGCDWIWLAVWEENTRAIQFYQRAGLTQSSRLEFPLGDVVHRDWMMRMHVST